MRRRPSGGLARHGRSLLCELRLLPVLSSYALSVSLPVAGLQPVRAASSLPSTTAAPTIAPLSDDEFASLMPQLRRGTKTVVAAVSGGPDSMALAILLHCYAVHSSEMHGRLLRVLGVTVDHGLRPESADEAEFVRETLNSFGIQHRTLRIDWSQRRSGGGSGPPNQARLQLLARKQRLDQLEQLCSDLGNR